MQNKRNMFILDVVRSLCMLWIVAVWHGNDYLPIEYHWVSVEVPETITNVVLLLFTLLSGMLLSKYSFSSKIDVWNFYKRRWERFYILFVIAVLLFYLCGFYALRTSVKCALGISVFIGQSPYTLWYMSMLMIFYLLTPLLRYEYKKVPIRIISPLFILAGIALLRIFNVITNNSLIQYFVSYELGLLIGAKVISWLRNHDWNAPASIRILFEKIAYASFCMYLYHRVIYYAVGRIGGFADYGSIVFCMPIWCNVVALSLIVGISYAIQLSYDKMFKNISMKNITLNN